MNFNIIIEYKNEIIRDKKVLLKKPYTLLLLPFLLIRFIYLRFKKNVTTVYLLEMDLTPKGIRDFKYIIIDKYGECQEIIKKRIIEENRKDNYEGLVKKRLEKGDRIYLLYDNKIPVSFLFVSYKEAILTPINYKFTLPENYIAIYDVYTFSEYRGKGYYKDLFNFTINYNYLKGYRKVYLWLMKHNKVSIISHNKIGIDKVVEELIEEIKYFRRKIYRKKVLYNSLNLIEQ